jgi:hypothetical protein
MESEASRCSFCGKSSQEVLILVASENANICEGCIVDSLYILRMSDAAEQIIPDCVSTIFPEDWDSVQLLRQQATSIEEEIRRKHRGRVRELRAEYRGKIRELRAEMGAGDAFGFLHTSAQRLKSGLGNAFARIRPMIHGLVR